MCSKITHPLFSALGNDLQEEVLSLLDAKSAASFCLTDKSLATMVPCFASQYFCVSLFKIIDDEEDASEMKVLHEKVKLYFRYAKQVDSSWDTFFLNVHTAFCVMVKKEIEDASTRNDIVFAGAFVMLNDVVNFAKPHGFHFPTPMATTLVFSTGENPITGEEMTHTIHRDQNRSL